VNFVKPLAYYTLTSIDARLRDKIHRRAETPRSLTDPNVNPHLPRQKESLYDDIPSYPVISKGGQASPPRKDFMIRKLTATSNDIATTFLRLVLGVIFFAHGAQKMLGWFGGYGFTGTMGFFTGMLHIPAVFAFLAIAAEFFGGLGLVFGLFTRVAAFGIFCNMLVAVAMVHHQFGFFMNWTGAQKGEGYEYHLVLLAASVVLMIRGAGAASVDRLLSSPAKNSIRTQVRTQAA
jgi:putative oxidoreductase